MLDFQKLFNVLTERMRSIAEFLSGSARDGSGQLDAAIILALLTAILATLGYLGKHLVQGLLHLREERKKYRSAMVRYVYDADIWRNDFSKNFSRAELDKWSCKLIDGPDDFKLTLGSSREEDAQDIMTYLHWLRPREIYSIRLFIAYSELFDSMCGILSSSEFAAFDRARKLNALITTQRVGIDAYGYAVQSLEALRKPEVPLLAALAVYLFKTMAGLVYRIERHHLSPAIKFSPAYPNDAQPPDYVPTDWAGSSLEEFRQNAEERLEKVSNKRRKRL
ncbi:MULTISPECIES: hypothetical protein [unclassified Neorhizobium]|uniref:hypothetical protein n=1 Tax=unclassified Neorhizobium TaxID=2629175 RepID=UPI001FF3CF49|nr:MULTISPECIES: hypothetical protein [unclassified Neorhizobium]MCJ9674289.1 hypothetical protein [Neorhizobium sp. SHOUNA12B]MCJ9748953.1 hypothetical protein [Neorhizobium sp. SHOUNA12A]